MSKGLFSADETLAGWFDEDQAAGLFDADLLDAWFATLSLTESDDSLAAATLATVGAASAPADADDTLATAVGAGISAASALTDVSDAVPGTYWAPGYWSAHWWSATWWELRLDGPASVLVAALGSGAEVDDALASSSLSSVSASAGLSESADSEQSGGTLAIAAACGVLDSDDALACDVLTGGIAGGVAAALAQTDEDDALSSDGAIAFLPTQSTGGIVSWHQQGTGSTPIRGPRARPKRALPAPEALTARAVVREDEDLAAAVSGPQVQAAAAVGEDADRIAVVSGAVISARLLRFECPDALSATARVDWAGQIATEDRLLELGGDPLMAEWWDEAA